MLKKKLANEERTFGVEVEWLGHNLDRHTLASEMRAEGFDVSVGHYHHTAPAGFWKIENDGSCGKEVISPILQGTDGLDQLETVLEIMNNHDAKVNYKCGVHVHHDASDFELKEFKILMKYYTKFEQAIDQLVPNSRRANHNTYCRTLGLTTMNGINYKNYFDKVDETNSLTEIRDIHGRDRYRKVNLEAYIKHGTVEFRQHSGSTNPEKIINWIKITQAIVERATRERTYIRWEGNGDLDSLLNTKEFTGLGFKRYYRSRRRELA